MSKVNIFSLSLRRIIMFLAGVLSLIFGGIIIGEHFESKQFIILSISGLSGVMLLYNDKNHLPNENWFNVLAWFLKRKSNVLFIVTSLILIPFSLLHLSILSFALLSFTVIIGVMYSLNFKIGNTEFKLKNILFLKNILIGLGWGSLVTIGAGRFAEDQVIFLTIFMILQVFLGSIIRDLPDVKSDIKNGVKSIPVVFGISNSIWIMHIINLSALLLLIDTSFELRLVIIILVTWRFINLLLIKLIGINKHLIQTFNLATCYLFFIILLLQHYYGYY